MVASTHHTSMGADPQSVPTITEAILSLRSSKKSSSSTSSNPKPNYAPSIASTTTSTNSMDKPLLSSKSSSKKRSSLGQKAKKLWSDIGSSPTADYDRQQLEKGEMTDGQKAFSKMDFPATLGDTRQLKG
jgi:hypothetical protein